MSDINHESLVRRGLTGVRAAPQELVIVAARILASEPGVYPHPSIREENPTFNMGVTLLSADEVKAADPELDDDFTTGDAMRVLFSQVASLSTTHRGVEIAGVGLLDQPNTHMRRVALFLGRRPTKMLAAERGDIRQTLEDSVLALAGGFLWRDQDPPHIPLGRINVEKRRPVQRALRKIHTNMPDVLRLMPIDFTIPH